MKKTIVLLGGGHTHALVLRSLVGRSLPYHIKLVSESPTLLYTGMLPGFIAGHYSLADISIDLPLLCRHADVEFIEGRVLAVDEQTINTDRQQLTYDIASLNLGISSSLPDQTDAKASLPLKSVIAFMSQWQQLSPLIDHQRLAVVGGGAGSLEVALALARRYPSCHISLITAKGLLPDYAKQLVVLARQRLKQTNIELIEDCWVSSFTHQQLTLNAKPPIDADYVFWATHGIAPQWLRDSPFSRDEKGFIKVNQQLQSISHSNVFAVGDIAAMVGYDLPKAGVFAVRQAPTLTGNLLAQAANQLLAEYHPQPAFLTLLSLGNKTALGQRGGLCFSGRWVWYWKDYLDRSFVRRLSFKS